MQIVFDSDPRWAGNAQYINGALRIGPVAPGQPDLAMNAPVILHEYAHGLTRSALPQLGRTPMSRAIAEAISDVMAAAITGQTRIGPFRDIAAPHHRSVEAWEDAMRSRGRGVPLALHSLGATLASTAARAAGQVGWGPVADAWYGATTRTFGPRIDWLNQLPIPDVIPPDQADRYRLERERQLLINLFAQATVDAADSLVREAIRTAWEEIGVELQGPPYALPVVSQ